MTDQNTPEEENLSYEFGSSQLMYVHEIVDPATGEVTSVEESPVHLVIETFDPVTGATISTESSPLNVVVEKVEPGTPPEVL